MTGRKPTKTDKIRAMLDRGKTTTEISELLGVTVTYARAVRNRVRNKATTGTSMYPNQLATQRRVKRELYHNDPEYRERVLANQRRWIAKKRAAQLAASKATVKSIRANAKKIFDDPKASKRMKSVAASALTQVRR